MRAGSLYLLLGLLFCLGYHATSEQHDVGQEALCITSSNSDAASLTFDELTERLQDNESDMFKEGVEQMLSDGTPTLEDLKAIVTALNTGIDPDFVTDYGYTLTFNDTSKFADQTNSGTYNMYGYGLLESLGTKGSYSMLSIVSTKGEIDGYAYTVSSSLFGRVNYTKSDNSLKWQGSASGVYLMLMPDKTFMPYGTHVAAAEGLALAHEGEAISTTELLFIMNSTYYSSRTTGLYTGKSDSESNSGNFNMFSLTGGTNATIGISTNYSSEDNMFLSELNMVLRNDMRESVMNLQYKGFFPYDKSNLFSDKNLFSYFQALFYGVNTYLP